MKGTETPEYILSEVEEEKPKEVDLLPASERQRRIAQLQVRSKTHTKLSTKTMQMSNNFIGKAISGLDTRHFHSLVWYGISKLFLSSASENQRVQHIMYR